MLMGLILPLLLLGGAVGSETARAYVKAIEGKENVKRKIYPKRKKFELSVPNVGLIMNQSYIDTVLVNGGFKYFFNEKWGVGLDFAFASNADKSERGCIENFYNDPNEEVPIPCGSKDELVAAAAAGNCGGVAGTTCANFGPAYVPIREIDNIITLNAVWTPIYGKQLVLLSATSHFDLFFEFGGGLVNSQYYAKRDSLNNTNSPRGTFQESGVHSFPPLQVA